MTYKPNIVIFHFPCPDGINAANVVYDYYSTADIEFVRGNYADKQEILDNIEKWRDKDILLVDFSYPKDILEKMSQSAKSVVILDHHITAQKALEDYIVEGDFDDPKYLNVKGIEKVLEDHKIVAIFDMEECGSTLTWKFFNPGKDIPIYLEYIKDIDLGRKKLPGADDFLWASRAIPLDIADNSRVLNTITTPELMETFKKNGASIEMFVSTRLGVLMEETHEGIFGQEPFKWGITDYALSSEYANRMVKESGYKFAVAVYFTKSGLGLSFRSVKDFDVSVIAKELGGGGHAQAAGVNLPWADVPEFVESLITGGVITLDV